MVRNRDERLIPNTQSNVQAQSIQGSAQGAERNKQASKITKMRPSVGLEGDSFHKEIKMKGEDDMSLMSPFHKSNAGDSDAEFDGSPSHY